MTTQDWKFQRILEDYSIFMQKLTSNCDEPVTLTTQECESHFDRIRSDEMFQDKFFQAVDVRSNEIFFSHRTEEVLAIEGRVTLPKVFSTIHQDYLEDFLQWAKVAYTYTYSDEPKESIVPLRQVYRIRVPMLSSKKLGGGYFWVRQESRPLQVDRNRNLVSHLNIYSRESHFVENDRQPLIGDVIDDSDSFHEKVWTASIRQLYAEDETLRRFRPFVLTPREKEIMMIHIDLGDRATTNEVASTLAPIKKGSVKKYTVDQHHKHIKQKAAEAFPHLKFRDIKELAKYLANLGWPWEEYRL